MVERRKGQFLPGNPGGPGRPKKQPTTRELLQEISPQAVARLGDLIHSDNEGIALQASIAVIKALTIIKISEA